MSDFLKEVSRGAQSWSPRILIASFFLTLVLLGGMEWALRDNLWRFIPQSVAMETRYDSVTENSYTVERLSRRADPGISVLFFGGSGIREALLRGDSLDLTLRRAVGKSVFTHQLGSIEQTFGEMWVLIEQVGKGRKKSSLRTVAVMGVNPSHLVAGPQDYLKQLNGEQYPFLSPGLSTLLKQENVATPWRAHFAAAAASSRIKRWLRERLRVLFSEQSPLFPSAEYLFDQEQSQPIQMQTDVFYQLLKPMYVTGYAANAEFNLRVLAECIRLCRGLGIEPVLVEQPASPLFRSLFGSFVENYRSRMREFARLNQVLYWESLDSDLPQNDYYDFLHLTPKGRKVYSDKLMEAVAGYLKQTPQS